eukprot:CAMPEP_0197639762 /NCGR_PEP_ID=MMETSP1338-20131121/14283_1 /TAXON_ID=43686 ORGANISM="Pelagodinium beii, Strain RCC1491" /NCGR_SAMPLE_ID=MMETSP1338 /ASSEMBLY_ACC=CAM_ASM_000754 /LENGTH=206 /DNA_ID=CAMNT_0043212533 /DNA_START=109 /DNA_END=726 /DNA_ORIENTATION=+
MNRTASRRKLQKRAWLVILGAWVISAYLLGTGQPGSNVAATLGLANVVSEQALRNPILAGFMTCFCKGSFCDAFAQRVVQKQSRYNGWRNLGFALYSGLYCGVWQSLLFNGLYDWLFGDQATMQIAVIKSVFDATVHTPFSYLPCAYMASNAFGDNGPRHGLQKYVSDIWRINLTCASIWIPAHIITFAIIPVHLRIEWAACVSAV